MSHGRESISITLKGPPPLAERLLSPLQSFARLEASSGILLLACAAIAMVLANGPLGDEYRTLLHEKLTLSFGSWKLALSVEHFINDALMAVFFFLVGLEIKREALVGELSDIRKAALPVLAAVGGMLGPGLIYAAFNWGQPTIRGWGIPTATDIAFSLGVLALLGKRVPTGLRVFLATLAIADDIGALVVIAVFYTENLRLENLAWAGACLAVMSAMNVSGVRRSWPYALVALLLWYFVLQSGVHATIAGVLAALTIPVRTRVPGSDFVGFGREALTEFEREGQSGGQANGQAHGPANGHDRTDKRAGIVTNSRQQSLVQALEDACNKVQTPLHQIEHACAPWVAYLIIPVFALANAGVEIADGLGKAFAQRETLGVALGLMLGKPIGITLMSLLAVKSGLGRLPTGVTWRHIHGASWLAGIGFTMSLFIAQLAFKGESAAMQLNDAKLGILAGSMLAGCVGFAILWLNGRRSTP